MINLTRLDGGRTALNEEHIERVESHPDTVIYLTYGPHLVVRESVEEVLEAVLESRAEILRRSSAPAVVRPAAGDRPAASDRPAGPDRSAGIERVAPLRVLSADHDRTRA